MYFKDYWTVNWQQWNVNVNFFIKFFNKKRIGVKINNKVDLMFLYSNKTFDDL